MADELTFFDSSGALASHRVEYGPDAPPVPGSPLLVRGVRLSADRRPYLQRRLPASRASQRELMETLEDEVRVGLALARAFGRDSYPPEFARLAAYDLAADEPFVLLQQGGENDRPVSRVVGKLLTAEQRMFEHSLIRSVRLLGWAGLVHRAINPSTVLWNGDRVQLTSFGHAEVVGRPRRRVGGAPWASPEQREAVGVVDPRDDIWSVGQLIHHVVTSQPGSDSGPPRYTNDLGGGLEDLLERVFEPRAHQRPEARTLLARISAPDPCDELLRPTDELAEGRAMFDRLLRSKGQGAWPPFPGSDTASGRRGGEDRGDAWGRAAARDGRAGPADDGYRGTGPNGYPRDPGEREGAGATWGGYEAADGWTTPGGASSRISGGDSPRRRWWARGTDSRNAEDPWTEGGRG
ncbi:serine/threonine-protein kinase [Wenjunlia tyrosinilytica]|uniref:Protein kinase domain-containing protein n=1 Tax=Wenjunlia tyrosinilytica TaxID=1544741 RepID=A0A918DW06_9ACTN|nr:serine/threonine-protein kinase [Wenjunlia tyrosinilytica]GGO84189.1 hypothetical protein GCM10012280_15090 [Wenjunlia tyrosinilytica]